MNISRLTRSALVCALLALAGAAAHGVGYLEIHPDNRHYFREHGTNRPVLIASVTAIVPEYLGYDYVLGLNDTILRRRLSYSRVWHFGSYTDSNCVMPWAFSTTTGACYAVPRKFDLNTWNNTYFTRLADAMSRANAGDVYAEMMIFERCHMSPASPDRWGGNPFASENNINNLETPTCTSDGTPEFYDYANRPNLRYQQERWLKKLVDTTISYPNMVYEIENEHWESSDTAWVSHYSQFLKNYLATNYPTQPRLVSYSSLVEDLEACYTIPTVDIVNRHYGNAAEDDPSIMHDYIESHWTYNKPVNIDEFANGVTDPALLRNMCWTIVTSGGNFHIEDAADSARPADICENIRSFIALSGWDFIHSSPDSGVIISGGEYCMKNPGVEYVCYFPTSGNKTLNIPSGSYRVEWWDPATAGFYSITNISHGGGNRTFTPPDSSDWVLHVSANAAPTTVLTSKLAGTITIDGSTSDWNLAEFTTKIRGGSTGTGNIGIVEFDTNGVCYVGGHYDGWQILPSSATDHAVRIYSRNDESYLYFLIRCDDDDIRYPNGVSSNSSNDCVEFYIDPGHDRGSAAMSSSTSDVRLVIDANNQRNVYNTTSGYKTQVLGGVTSAVVRDATGWWLEARISKTALDPDIPSGSGTIGIDFTFRDNDNNNDATRTTICSWRDPEVSTGFPTKIPNRWGDLNLQGPPDAIPPGPVTSFAASPGYARVSLSWHNPPESDFIGTMVRYKTTGYPTSAADGTLLIDKPNSPNTDDTYTHAGLTNGATYYYSAFAHDEVPNYAAKTDASATPSSSAYCFSDGFAYPDGALNGNGGWGGTASTQIAVENQCVKIWGGSVSYDAIQDISPGCEGDGILAGVEARIRRGSGTQTMWSLYIDDASGSNLARWYGTGSTARGRIDGSNTLVTAPQTLTGDWDTTYAKINFLTNRSEFFFNGVSIGEFDHSWTGAGDSIGRLRIERIDYAPAAAHYVYLDDLGVGPADITSPVPTAGGPSVSVTRTGPVGFEVDFGEPVFGFDSSDDVQVNATGTAAGAVSLTGSGSGPYTVTLSDVTGSGTLGITVKSAACYDKAGNSNTAGSASPTARVIAEDGLISATKLLPDDQLVELGNKALYLKQNGFAYIEEPDRTSGIRLQGAITPGVGDLVCLTGTMKTTASGERYILVDLISPCGSLLVAPFGLSNRWLLDGKLTGLYVRCWGKVKPGSIMGDSYVLTDGSDAAGIKVITPAAPGVGENEFVTPDGAAGYGNARVIYSR